MAIEMLTSNSQTVDVL